MSSQETRSELSLTKQISILCQTSPISSLVTGAMTTFRFKTCTDLLTNFHMISFSTAKYDFLTLYLPIVTKRTLKKTNNPSKEGVIE